MKTKPFLLATAGSTIDGRAIDDAMIDQMASSYDPKTYGARLNIEHIRGISGDKPFRAYGDVLELSVGETEVNFNGTTEKRKALFGVFDVTDDAKALNDAHQKVYPSIEIQPNFADKGYAYCVGVALTDSPAAIGTERLQFNRSLPGALKLTADQSGIEAAELQFANGDPEGGAVAAEVRSGFAKIAELFSGKPKEEPKPEPKADPAGFDAAAFAAGMQALGDGLAASITTLAKEQRAATDKLAGDFNAFKTQLENTRDPNFTQRPLGTGPDLGETDKFY